MDVYTKRRKLLGLIVGLPDGVHSAADSHSLPLVPPHKFESQLIACTQGLYSRGKDLKWKQVKDVQVLGTMGLPGGARNATDPRLLSLATAFSVQMPSDDSLRGICLPILAHHVASLGPDIACTPQLLHIIESEQQSSTDMQSWG